MPPWDIALKGDADAWTSCTLRFVIKTILGGLHVLLRRQTFPASRAASARVLSACLDGMCKQQQKASEEVSEHFSDGNAGLITQGIFAHTRWALVR